MFEQLLSSLWDRNNCNISVGGIFCLAETIMACAFYIWKDLEHDAHSQLLQDKFILWSVDLENSMTFFLICSYATFEQMFDSWFEIHKDS